MKKFSIKTIRSWNPCYDPVRYLPETWYGTALDILEHKEIPFQDKLWVILRTDLVSEKLMRIFAVWCARQVQHLMEDERSIAALDFMDAYIDNYWLIDDEDWRVGWDAARTAARDAAWDAGRDAGRDTGSNAAWHVAMAVAWDAAWYAARAVAWDAQQVKLKELLIAGLETGDTL